MSRVNVKIHWLGAGLSSKFGLHEITHSPLGKNLILWNRSHEKALLLANNIGLPHAQVRVFRSDSFLEALQEGDVVVSFLPATQHLEIAEICLKANCHLLTSSYVSEEMRNLHEQAREKGLYFINELGLDPGLDHFVAHRLVEGFKNCVRLDGFPTEINFYSACGGFPAEPGEFKYKFSWSPLGVLRALKNNAVFLKMGESMLVARPYRESRNVVLGGECFESYSNRNSLPFIADYGLEEFLPQLSFERATLRPKGWASQWKDLFAQLESVSEHELESISRELFEKYAYGDGERDRVVLDVSLTAKFSNGKERKWRGGIDLNGTENFSAMSKLVSGPVVSILRLFLRGELEQLIQPGVSGWPKGLHPIHDLVGRELDKLNIPIQYSVHEKFSELKKSAPSYEIAMQ